MTKNENEVEFKVAAKTDTQKLAKAALTNLRQGKLVTLITIGHGSVGQAMKAIPILNQETIARGHYYAVVPSFETREIIIKKSTGDETVERTVMKLKLVEQRI